MKTQWFTRNGQNGPTVGLARVVFPGAIFSFKAVEVSTQKIINAVAYLDEFGVVWALQNSHASKQHGFQTSLKLPLDLVNMVHTLFTPFTGREIR